jgi:hypothetical protein
LESHEPTDCLEVHARRSKWRGGLIRQLVGADHPEGLVHEDVVWPVDADTGHAEVAPTTSSDGVDPDLLPDSVSPGLVGSQSLMTAFLRTQVSRVQAIHVSPL